MKQTKKLALFDIDGTLITTRGKGVSHWQQSITASFARVFRPLPEFDGRKLNGKLERQYFRELADLIGVTEQEFDAKFPDVIAEFNRHFIRAIDTKQFEVLRIPEAYDTVLRLKKSPHVEIGLLTGNNEALAWHKMKAADFADTFSFGVFGTEKSHRGELVKHAAAKAAIHFNCEFSASDIIVIGDTKHDIEAAKYAGAFALGVTTGLTDTREDLERAGADLIVDMLTESAVLTVLP